MSCAPGRGEYDHDHVIAILESYRAGLLTRPHLWRNVVSGVVVGVVALPLAMAFAIASGARPEQGLYTAIVAGLCTSLFGGTRLQISGPTGAFIVVLAAITAQHGIKRPATGDSLMAGARCWWRWVPRAWGQRSSTFRIP